MKDKPQILPLYLFPEAAWFAEYQSITGNVQIELCDTWQKQSPRTRYEIFGPNGKQQLIVPTVKSTREKMVNVEIDYSTNWNTQHLRSLVTAYNNSPYFEFYRDGLEELLMKPYDHLTELSLESVRWCLKMLKLDIEFKTTEEFLLMDDYKLPLINISYHQVFMEKLGFIPNLTVLDLLFNTGPEAQMLIR